MVSAVLFGVVATLVLLLIRRKGFRAAENRGRRPSAPPAPPRPPLPLLLAGSPPAAPVAHVLQPHKMTRASHVEPDARAWRVCQLRTRAFEKAVLAIDCETTGLGDDDRIVSFAAVALRAGRFSGPVLYFVFNPERRSHPAAFRAHGLADAFLSGQPLFRAFAPAIGRIIDAADLIVAHNAAFDMRFLLRELALANVDLSHPPRVFCTMRGFAADYPGVSKSLASACRTLDLGEQDDVHSALQDALLAARLFQALNGFATDEPPPFLPPGPQNQRSSGIPT